MKAKQIGKPIIKKDSTIIKFSPPSSDIFGSYQLGLDYLAGIMDAAHGVDPDLMVSADEIKQQNNKPGSPIAIRFVKF